MLAFILHQLSIINYIIIDIMLENLRKHIEITDKDLEKQVIFKKKDELYFMILNRPKANSFDHSFIR